MTADHYRYGAAILILGIIIGLLISLVYDTQQPMTAAESLAYQRENMFMRCMGKIADQRLLPTADQRVEITNSCRQASLAFYPDKIR